MLIKQIKAIKILNSRAEPTIAVEVKSRDGFTGWGAAPSGASKGKHEVPAYGKNIEQSISYINKLNLNTFDSFGDLERVEEKVDVKKAGANGIIALEFALLNLLSQEEKKPVWKILNPRARGTPMPLGNVIGGGAHADSKFDVQEILISPKTKTFSQAALLNARIYGDVKEALEKKDKLFTGGTTDEGAWMTSLSDLEAIELVYDTSRKYKVRLGLDIASSHFYKNNKYVWQNYAKGKKIIADKKKQIELVKEMSTKFKLFYIEDPLQEEDFSGYAELNKNLKNICGDDLTTTNIERLKQAIKQKSIAYIIIKPNQIGSLIQTKQVFDLAVKKGIIPVISHRSGETDDVTISHLAKAWQAPLIKCGIASGERIAKINELIKIEKEQ